MRGGNPVCRVSLATVLAVVILPLLWAQQPGVGTVPPEPRGGPVEVVHALFVQAQMVEGGQVMFCFPRGEKQQPDFTAKVDGKEVRAVGVDLKPLDVAELGKRLPGYTAVVVVQAEFELPDAFFLKVLRERSVIFVLPKTMFAPMAKASEARLAPGQPRP
jgi:hypothetical protein